jgi:prefoldin subunit 5
MQNTADRLASLHNQLNQYVYLTENLDELRLNVQQIEKLHSEVEKERSIIKNFIQRATIINPELAILCTDFEEKRVEVRTETNEY